MKEEVTYIFDATSWRQTTRNFEELFWFKQSRQAEMVMEQIDVWRKNKIIYVIEAGGLRIDCFSYPERSDLQVTNKIKL